MALVVKKLLDNAGDIRDLGSIPGLGGSCEGGLGNPPQYSCLENSMDRRAWQATVRGVARVRHDLANECTYTQPINNIVLLIVSGVQQGDSVIQIHISILFQILFPFRLL